jgi:hypothetical protein
MRTEAALYTVTAVLLVFLLMLIACFVCLSLLKVSERRRRALTADWTQRFLTENSRLFQYLRSGKVSRKLRFTGTMRMEALEGALIELMRTGPSTEQTAAITRFAEQHLTEHYRKRLSGGAWSVRVNTILYIEHFRMDTLADELTKIVERPKAADMERFLAMRAFAVGSRREVIQYIIRFEPKLSDNQMLQLLNPLSVELLNELMIQFDELTLRLRLNVIDVLRIRNERTEAVLDLLERSAVCEVSEQRIRSLHALANFGFMTGAGFRALLRRIERNEDAPWEERLMRAKAMGSVREAEFLVYLETLLSDPVYLVRQQAAESISKYKEGIRKLEYISSYHPDRFAREMADEVIERVRYERNMA